MPELTHLALVIAGSLFISIYVLTEYVLFISKHLFVVVPLLAPWVPACYFSTVFFFLTEFVSISFSCRCAAIHLIYTVKNTLEVQFIVYSVTIIQLETVKHIFN